MGDSVYVGLRAEFGSGLYRGARPGIPYVVVPKEQLLVPIEFTTYGGPRGPYPVSPDAELHVIINTLKQYGMIMTDNGGPFFITGAPDARRDDLWLRHLLYITGDNLDMVDTGPIRGCAP
jgi:hypothetical protein